MGLGADSLLASENSILSTVNSTTTPLGSSGVFTGAYESLENYNSIYISLFADQTSLANSGLIIVFSDDAAGSQTTNIVYLDYLVANIYENYWIPKQGNYFVVQYTNGTTAQSTFRLKTYLRNKTPGATSSMITAKENAYSQAGKLFLDTKTYNYGRLPEVRKRVYREAFITNVTLGSGTVIFTCSAGFAFYLETLIISAVNPNTTIGSFCLQDGTDTTDRIPFVIPAQPSGGIAGNMTTSVHFGDDPKQFTSDVRAVELAGDIRISVYIKGYEEVNI